MPDSGSAELVEINRTCRPHGLRTIVAAHERTAKPRGRSQELVPSIGNLRGLRG
jgi:hypothetical protein